MFHIRKHDERVGYRCGLGIVGEYGFKGLVIKNGEAVDLM